MELVHLPRIEFRFERASGRCGQTTVERAQFCLAAIIAELGSAGVIIHMTPTDSPLELKPILVYERVPIMKILLFF